MHTGVVRGRRWFDGGDVGAYCREIVTCCQSTYGDLLHNADSELSDDSSSINRAFDRSYAENGLILGLS